MTSIDQPATSHPDLVLIGLAMRRDPQATRALVVRLRPPIQAAVARTLARHAPMGGARNLREEVADLCQDVFRLLFDKDGKVLRSWSPERGASLETFVRLVAQRHALSMLRTKRRSPWTEEPKLDIDQMLPDERSPEALTATREILRRVVDELREELSPKGLALFEMLIVDEASVPEVQSAFGMSRDAVYAWRSRLSKNVRAKASHYLSDPAHQSRRSGEEAP